MIKPDGVRRGFIGEVLCRIEQRGLTIEELEICMTTPGLLGRHYADLVNRPFFSLIANFTTSGPVITGVMPGNKVITSWCTMMGTTSPKEALPGTIRGNYVRAPSEGGTTFSAVHGSDSLKSIEHEIAFWFGE